MKDFFKFMIFGALGLVLSLSFPQIRVDWMAIVLAQAFLDSRSRFSAWLCVAALAWFYSAFSLAASWQLALPPAIAVLLFFALKNHFSMSLLARRAFLLSLVLASQALFWSLDFALLRRAWFLTWSDLAWFAVTTVVALGLLPLLGRFSRRLTARLFAWTGSGGSLDLRRAEWFGAKAPRLNRKPFGLEKGI